MITVILDTNFIIYCAEYKIDYESEISRLFNERFAILTTDQIIDELEDLADNRVGKERAVIELAKSILDNKIEKKKVQVKEVISDDADFSVIELAIKSERPFIATLDKKLKEEASKRLKNAQFLTIKQKTHLKIL